MSSALSVSARSSSRRAERRSSPSEAPAQEFAPQARHKQDLTIVKITQILPAGAKAAPAA